MRESYEEAFWAIYNPEFGLYTDTALTRKEMILRHCASIGSEWSECRKRGDRAVKVKIIYSI